jgi:hypothetical protein
MSNSMIRDTYKWTSSTSSLNLGLFCSENEDVPIDAVGELDGDHRLGVTWERQNKARGQL